MSTYSEKLRSPEWQKKRLEVLGRDKFTCQLCSDATTELHVHHFSYEFGKNPWEYPLENFITYCKYCHKLVELYKDNSFYPVLVAKSIEKQPHLIAIMFNKDKNEYGVGIHTIDSEDELVLYLELLENNITSIVGLLNSAKILQNG